MFLALIIFANCILLLSQILQCRRKRSMMSVCVGVYVSMYAYCVNFSMMCTKGLSEKYLLLLKLGMFCLWLCDLMTLAVQTNRNSECLKACRADIVTPITKTGWALWTHWTDSMAQKMSLTCHWACHWHLYIFIFLNTNSSKPTLTILLHEHH